MNIFVTGANDGIGGSIALRLVKDAVASEQAPRIVIATSKPSSATERLQQRLEEEGAEVRYEAADLSSAEQCEALARKVAVWCPRLDVFVSNAGIVRPSSLLNAALDDWNGLFNVNVRATWLLARGLHSSLKVAQGSIVGISSMSGVNPHPGHAAYSASKAALNMLCRQMAQEWAGDRIRVNVVAPGMIRTPMTANIYEEPDVEQRRSEVIPLGRIGTADDVAAAVGFLAGAGSAYVTGQVLRVEGGYADTIMRQIPGRFANPNT